MKELIIANWKMNPGTEREAVRLAREVSRKVKGLKNAEVVVAPPFPFLRIIKSHLSGVKLGAQDVFWEGAGPYTGEVSARQLKSVGVEYVVIGHSEKRKLGETDEIVNRKIKAALKEKLKVVLCVGEPFSVRRKGFSAAKKFVKSQLRNSLKRVSSVVVAYEPIWAISSRSGGKSDTPEDAIQMAVFIKSFLKAKSPGAKPRVLYGGSVNSKNTRGFLPPDEIDGALVGKASLKSDEFRKIVEQAAG